MSAMNWTPIARIAWKDLRRIGALWVAFVASWSIYLFFATVAAHYLRGYLAPSYDQAFLAICATATVYGFSWAGITFAAEHDDKTYGQLRSLPVSAQHVFYGKVFFGVSSTLLLIATLGVLCGVHALALQRIGGGYQWGSAPLIEMTGFGLSLLVMLIPLGMAVGVFWSLRLKHPLQAVGLAAASTVILPYACFAIPAWFAALGDFRELGAVYSYFPLGFLVSVVFGLILINRRLVTDWLPNYSQANLRRGQAMLHSASNPDPTGSSLGRLFWLHRRQSFWLTRGLVYFYLLLACLHFFDIAVAKLVAAFLTPIGIATLGITAFHYEHQETRFRWLAQLSARAFGYWISRLLVPGIAAFVIAAITVWINQKEIQSSEVRWDNWVVFYALLTIFAIAQFCSMAISSVVISVAVTLITTCVAFTWIWFCTALLIPTWLSILPIVILPLAASYLRVSRWFRETGSWKQWIVPLVPLAVLVVGLPLATACYRVYEVPGVEIPSDMLVEPAQPTPEELSGAAQLNAVLAQLAPRLSVEEFDLAPEQHAALAESLIKALDGTSTLPREFEAVGSLRAAGDVLRISGRRETAAGNLAEAWVYYRSALDLADLCQGPRSSTFSVLFGHAIESSIYSEMVPWAMHEGNSWEMVESSALDIDDRRQSLAPWTDAVRNDRNIYLDALSALIANPEQSNELPGAHLARFFPWEVARAKRLADYRLTHEFIRMQHAQQASAGAERDNSPLELAQDTIDRLASTTLFPAGWIPTEDQFIAAERDRRATICQLAAIAYHRRHGTYPHDMTELTLAGRPLPDDIYSPGKLVILGSEGDDFTGPRLVSSRARTSATFSPGVGHRAHFLLPVFENWDPQRFEERIARTAPNTRSLPEGNQAEAKQEYANWQSPGEPDARAWLGLLPEETVSNALERAVRHLLREGSVEERADLLNRFLNRPQLALRFLPEVVQQLDSPDVDLAARAAILFLRAVRSNQSATSEVVEETPSRLSTGPTAGDLGAPVRNPENGHFYELIKGRLNWDRAQRSAASRTFRGVSGHLATITTQSESDFVEALIAASTTASISVWLGGNDRDQAGVWRWVCGPEAGNSFWGSKTETASEFTNWLDGEPAQAGFLILEVATGGVYGGRGAEYGGIGGYGGGEYGGMGGWHSEMGGEFGDLVEDSGGLIEFTSGWRSSRRKGFEDDYALVEYEIVDDLNPEPETVED